MPIGLLYADGELTPIVVAIRRVTVVTGCVKTMSVALLRHISIVTKVVGIYSFAVDEKILKIAYLIRIV